MPNYDGTGPLKRGRIIGRGIGPCHAHPGECLHNEDLPEQEPRQKKTAEPHGE